MKRRILAAVPMISLLAFLISGLYLENWSLGWTFFLLIPLSWILLTGKPLKKISESMPFIALLVFLWLGFGFGFWHPGWLVFLLVPLTNMMVERRIQARKIVSILIIGGYIAYGLITDAWHPGWIMLLLIPIVNTIFFPQSNAYVSFNSDTIKSKFKKIIIEHESRADHDDDDF